MAKTRDVPDEQIEIKKDFVVFTLAFSVEGKFYNAQISLQKIQEVAKKNFPGVPMKDLCIRLVRDEPSWIWLEKRK